jgi:hypothetical protein
MAIEELLGRLPVRKVIYEGVPHHFPKMSLVCPDCFPVQPVRRFGHLNATLGEGGMTTLQEIRKTLDEKVDHLRKLQWEKMLAPLEKQGEIQAEIDAISKQIVRLDTRVQELMKNRD